MDKIILPFKIANQGPESPIFQLRDPKTPFASPCSYLSPDGAYAVKIIRSGDEEY